MKDCYDPKAHFGIYPKKKIRKKYETKTSVLGSIISIYYSRRFSRILPRWTKKNNEPSLYFPMFYLRHHIIIMKLMLYYSFHIEMLRNYDASFKF